MGAPQAVHTCKALQLASGSIGLHGAALAHAMNQASDHLRGASIFRIRPTLAPSYLMLPWACPGACRGELWLAQETLACRAPMPLS
jgi:hypothetical protein